MIAATHGKRAVDNLAFFKPHIKEHEMDNEVTAFEESILFFADAYNKHGPGSRQLSPVSSGSTTPSLTPSLTPSSSAPSSRNTSRASSFVGGLSNLAAFRRPSFLHRVSTLLSITSLPHNRDTAQIENAISEEVDEAQIEAPPAPPTKEEKHQLAAWQIEAAAVDRSVRILPGVKNMMSSIPEGRYAVATSGAKTYGMITNSTLGIQI